MGSYPKKIKRVGIDDIYYIGIIIFFLLSSKMMYLIRLPDVANGMVLQCGLAIVLMLLIIATKPNLSEFHFTKIILIMLVYLLIQIFVTIFRYPKQPMYDTLSVAYPYTIILMYFVLRYYIKNEYRFQKFITLIAFLSVIVTTLLIIQASMYNNIGKIFLNIYGFSYGESIKVNMRNGNLRIPNSFEGYIRVSIIISAGYLFQRKGLNSTKKLIHICNVLIGVFGIYYVEQSRVYFLIMIITLSVMLVLSLKSFKIESYLKVIIIFTLVAIFFKDNLLSVLNSLIDTISDSNSLSNYARIGAIEYYTKAAVKNPIFGIGLLSGANNLDYYSILRGNLGIFYLDDVGFFGLIGRFGIISGIWYIFLLIKLYKLCILKSRLSIINTGIFLSMLLSSFTLIYLDHPRIVAMPISLAIAEYIYKSDYNVLKEHKVV